MASRYAIEIDAKEVVIGLSRLVDRFDNFTVPFRLISEDFKRIEQRRFDAEGPGWAPLSPAYAATKRGPQIMVESGDLRDALTGGSGYMEVITDNTAVFGTDIPYAKYHQYGTTTGLPARELINLNRTEIVGWVKILQGWAADEIRNAGLS